MPWPDTVQKVNDTDDFLKLQLKRFGEGEALHLSIFYSGKIVGVLGFNTIDQVNGIGQAGYWLGETFTGKGIMSKSVRELIRLGFSNWPLQKIEIHCAVDNIKSRAIPESLGFENEGTLRRAVKVHDAYQDHIVYGLLKEEYISNPIFKLN